MLAFLATPAAHGMTGGDAVTRIDTHAAAVFLAGSRALKVKRAVRFPFLDFSTLALRKAACEAEIEANRAFAPGLYRGVIAITREAGGSLAIGGHGAAVEYAVNMARFDETRTLDRLAGTGPLDDTLAEALGHVVAHGHAATPPADGAAWIAALESYIADNDAALRATPGLFAPSEVDSLTAACRAALTRVTPLLRRRADGGLVRRGHGDLHLGNIALIDGRPLPFDALEFDPLVASGDLLYDLAFLLMDLCERGQPRAASLVFNRYLAETGRDSDLDALAALPLFMALRAAIRAKVTMARPAFAASPTLRDDTRNYFAFARRAIAPPRPRLVAIGGLSGTGKSALARAYAGLLPPLPGAVVIRSDVERKALFGIAETGRLPPAAYAPEMTARVYARVATKARRAVMAGHSAIADAVFARPDERAAIEAAAREAGAAFLGLVLEADLATRLERVGGRVHDASDADAAVARQQESYDFGPCGWTRVSAAGTPDQTLANVTRAVDPV
ncbi:MAG: DNA-binding protein [Xanthobacteraceae bacterium]|nr:MAG: DNA-binding protein [Xanthobacteraceae bacterium]